MRRQIVIVIAVMGVVVAACTDAGTSDEGSAAPSSTEAPSSSDAPGTTDAPSTTASTTDSVCQDTDLVYLGLDGEAGEVELEQWRTERNVVLETSWPGSWPQFDSAVRVGQRYDIGTMAYHQAGRQIAAGIWQPLDLDRLENFDKLIPALRDNPTIRDADGNVYGVPIAWGDGPFIYHPERVENPPTSILELLEPEWEGRIIMFDNPFIPFSQLAAANGFWPLDEPRTLVTHEELEIIKEQAIQLVRNTASFAVGFQDATDILVAGDADLFLNGWEAVLTFAEEDGVTLAFDFLEESAGGGWWDGIGILSTAENVDCAYEYIDQMIATDTQVEIAQNLVSATVNTEAIPLISEDVPDYPYDLLLSGGLNNIQFLDKSAPEETEEGIANAQDWLDAWEEVKAAA